MYVFIMIIIDKLIVLFFLYGSGLYFIKNVNREKSFVYEIKNKNNVDELHIELKGLVKEETKSTKHIFVEDLPNNISNKIMKVDNEILDLLGPEYSSIPKINEVYYNAKKTKNSDLSFVRLHTDSPFHICKTYRVLVCIEPDENVITKIPDDKIEISFKKYQVLGFDYANTLHYIKINEERIKKNRILLKLHYSKSDICNKLTKRYTRWARSLYVNNKDNIEFSGRIMLQSQYLSTNLLEIVTVYLLLMVRYFRKGQRDKYLMYLLLIVGGVLTSYNLLFQMYFLWNDF